MGITGAYAVSLPSLKFLPSPWSDKIYPGMVIISGGIVTIAVATAYINLVLILRRNTKSLENSIGFLRRKSSDDRRISTISLAIVSFYLISIGPIVAYVGITYFSNDRNPPSEIYVIGVITISFVTILNPTLYYLGNDTIKRNLFILQHADNTKKNELFYITSPLPSPKHETRVQSRTFSPVYDTHDNKDLPTCSKYPSLNTFDPPSLLSPNNITTSPFPSPRILYPHLVEIPKEYFV